MEFCEVRGHETEDEDGEWSGGCGPAPPVGSWGRECILKRRGVVSEPGWLRGRRVMHASGSITFSPVPGVVKITIELVSGNRQWLY